MINNMKTIKNEKLDKERALYAAKDLIVDKCKFDGPADGESALKEARNIKVKDSFFNLRYPFWHNKKLEINNCSLTSLCRAALWYSKDVKINKSKLFGIKALRECKDIIIKDSKIDSPEFGWRNKNVTIENSELKNTEYLLFETSDIKIKNIKMQGKYTFQYTKNVVIENSALDTKDAFWHSKNVTVKNSTIKGQYLAWYSDGLTLINCKIIGTQPLCYCKNLKLVNCEMIDTDLAFEYSDVEATIKGTIDSVKNPKSGYIKADKIKDIILEDSIIKSKCIIKEKHH